MHYIYDILYIYMLYMYIYTHNIYPVYIAYIIFIKQDIYMYT